MAEHLYEEDTGAGGILSNGLGLPVLDGLDVENVVAQLFFLQDGRVGAEMLVDQAQVPVIAMPGAIGVVAQGEKTREVFHRWVRVMVVV